LRREDEPPFFGDCICKDPNIIDRSKSVFGRRITLNKAIIFVLAILGLGIAGIVLAEIYDSSQDKGYAPEQPIPFSHKTHVTDNKMECLYCHFNADKSRHATVPPMSLCMGCHEQVAKDRPVIKRMTEVYEEGKQLEWVKVHNLPEHVYFPHRRHVAAGVSCEECHGDVGSMAKVEQKVEHTMGWCLDCHRDNNYVNPSQGVGTPNYQTHRDMIIDLGPDAKYSSELNRNEEPAIHPMSHMNAPTSCSTCHQ
jgi:hypothetical protein